MSGRAARGIIGRTIISGRLVLETPAHLGNGDVVGVTDMPLLRDPRDGVTPLLTGASIAGALRSYLREVERGYGGKGQSRDLTERLFGRLDSKTTLQSWLLIDDALGASIGHRVTRRRRRSTRSHARPRTRRSTTSSCWLRARLSTCASSSCTRKPTRIYCPRWQLHWKVWRMARSAWANANAAATDAAGWPNGASGATV